MEARKYHEKISFEEALESGTIRKSFLDLELAKSLIKSSDNTFFSLKQIKLEAKTASSLMRELYESLRQICEAIAALKSYKIYTHEAITAFLEYIGEREPSLMFDRYRKIRNGINYYGRTISPEETLNALEEIPRLIQFLKEKYLKELLS